MALKLRNIAQLSYMAASKSTGASRECQILDTNYCTMRPNVVKRQPKKSDELKLAVERCRHMLLDKMYEDGIPGLVIAVSVDGKITWEHGFGYSDVENRIFANSNTVMRIGSISKSITVAAVGKLIEDGLLDLDKPVSQYVEAWPNHHPPITTRQLMSHTSGIRHYNRNKPNANESDSNYFDSNDFQSKATLNVENSSNKNRDIQLVYDKSLESNPGKVYSKYDERYIDKKFSSVTESLDLFKNDPLLHEPGSKFYYTTHGFTLLSAVMEAVTGLKFDDYIRTIFKDLKLSKTSLDENDTIICNRSKYYLQDKNRGLINAPNIDNSCKLAGGGFLSNVADLVKFGNAMISTSPKRFLKKETIQMLWYPVVFYSPSSPRKKLMVLSNINDTAYYGMGWFIMNPPNKYTFCKDQRYFVCHTGGAIGTSSVLLILPKDVPMEHEPRVNGGAKYTAKHNGKNIDTPEQPPSSLSEGVVVSIICNTSSVGMTKLALDIAKVFEKLRLAAGRPNKAQDIYQS